MHTLHFVGRRVWISLPFSFIVIVTISETFLLWANGPCSISPLAPVILLSPIGYIYPPCTRLYNYVLIFPSFFISPHPNLVRVPRGIRAINALDPKVWHQFFETQLIDVLATRRSRLANDQLQPSRQPDAPSKQKRVACPSCDWLPSTNLPISSPRIQAVQIFFACLSRVAISSCHDLCHDLLASHQLFPHRVPHRDMPASRSALPRLIFFLLQTARAVTKQLPRAAIHLRRNS